MSTRSVKKRGFLQKELVYALEVWKEKLEDDIYLIPVRLDKCDIPERLSGFEWVDLFEPDGLGRLAESISHATNLDDDHQDRILTLDDTVKFDIQTIAENQSEIATYEINVEFPRIIGLDRDIASEINDSIKGRIIDEIQRFRRAFVDSNSKTRNFHSENELNGGFEVTRLSRTILSVRLNFYAYQAPAAHGSHWFKSINYRFPPVVPIELADLFRPRADYFRVIANLCGKQLFGNDEEFENWISEAISGGNEVFHTFNLTNTSLLISFDDYEVGPYASGPQQAEIPLQALQSILNEETEFGLLTNNRGQ